MARFRPIPVFELDRYGLVLIAAVARSSQ